MTERILIIDQVATNRIVLKVRLARANYDVMLAENGHDALRILRKQGADLVICAPDCGDMTAQKLCQHINSDHALASVPVLILAAEGDGSIVTDVLRAGAEDVLFRPVADQHLLARIRRVMRARTTREEARLREDTDRVLGFAEPISTFERRINLTILSPDTQVLYQTKQQLKGSNQFNTQTFMWNDFDPEHESVAASDIFLVTPPQLGAGCDLSVITDLRSRSSTRHAAIVLVLPMHQDAIVSFALDLGADDVVSQNCSQEELALRLGRQGRRAQAGAYLRNRVADGLRAAVSDPLTGLYNRRYAIPHLERMQETALATNKPFTLMLLDLDHFKLVNDTFGHSVGDAVLIEVANRLRDNLRAIDLVARIGGEEFLVAMPATDLDEGRAAANRLRRIIFDTRIECAADHTPLKISVSIGMVLGGLSATEPDVHMLIAQADRGMYLSKQGGRNKVTVQRSAA